MNTTDSDGANHPLADWNDRHKNQDEKSQLKTAKAERASFAIVTDEIDEENAKLSAERRSLVGTGDRSENPNLQLPARPNH